MTREEAIKWLGQMENGTRIVEYRKALDMAISALQNQPVWIPVTERMPEIGRKCLIANGEIVKIGWIRPDGVWKTGVRHNDLWGRFSLHPPTHWMPLPQPPKEDA